jgi:hydroxymethylpyrimidine kinase/phosphomethylpyrimidine kinase
LSDLITPNIPEAERISRIKIDTRDDIEKAARLMQGMGAKNVLIKGGHFSGAGPGKAVDYLFEGGDLTLFEADLIETNATHGTGCTLSAAITANLALGRSLAEAVEIAKKFVFEAIRTAPNLGYGHSPINIVMS